MAKIGRNEPCPCRSGKKYKKCCGALPLTPMPPALRKLGPNEIPKEVRLAFEKHKAREQQRQQQQGMGNPIISVEMNGYRLVAVGSVMHYSKDWKTFHDFLLYYIKKVMDGDWGNKEIAKPYEQRHIILQWYDQICRYQQETIKEPGKVSSAKMIGVVEAYMHLAYNLYLLAHNTINNAYNTRLQQRLIKRLQNPNEFPGAYYESYVSAVLIKAGFEVELCDETSGNSSPDYIIKHKASGQKYTVEAKAIRRPGVLGASSGTSKTLEGSIRNQLYDALAKPSEFPRIIFVEANLPDLVSLQAPGWLEDAIKAVRGAENLTINGQPTEPAYVFVTNHPHHYHLSEGKSGRAAVVAGYKIPDFGHGVEFSSLKDMYYARQKYSAVHSIIDSIKSHYDIPSTFDGELPSVVFHKRPRQVVIGETYLFEDIGEHGLLAAVTSATVSKPEKVIYIGTDKGHILTCPISDAELEDYEKHPDTFFGVVHSQGKNTEDPYELFEWMLKSYTNTPKERLLDFMKEHPDLDQFKEMSQKELALTYCERCVYSILQQSKKAG